jgi:NAD(P)-dependent dehydrogenase (short-subunit alcohol dehydrogenase family)
MTSYAANYMVEHDVKGSIIYITSTHSLRAYPYDALYGSLKAGLNRAVESLACELGNYGIRVNAIAPGFIQVRFNNEWPEYEQNVKVLGKLLPLNRIGNPVDIANAIEFLASDDAKYITGVTVKVDGGLILAGMPESDKPEFNKRIWGYRDHYGFVRKKEEQK